MAMRKIATMLLVCLAFVYAEDNLLVNPGMEDQTPAFWSPLNGTFGTDVGVTGSDMAYMGFHSFMITKAAAGDNMVGWVSDNNADLYWNNAAAATYNLNYQVKLAGVNTSPASDDEKIGVMFEFYDGSGAELVTETLWADQSAADADWTEVSGVTILTVEPAEIIVKLVMGKDATGTAYFDNVNCGTTPDWSMGLFNGNAETVQGWMNWYASDNGSFGTVTDNDAHTGDYAQELYKPDTTSSTSEIVYYSIPAPVVGGDWYKIGVWVKTVGVNNDASYSPTFITKERLDERLGLCYFFHTDAVLDKGWSLEGGDKYVYVDQTTEDNDWTHYTVMERAPANATGISVRSRFTSNPTGTAYFDDFSVERMIEVGDNLVPNGSMEDQTPAFWSPLNGVVGTDVGVTGADMAYDGFHSLMITKDAAGDNMIGWMSDNNADLYWNNAAGATYNLNYQVKLAGVNTSPTTDDEKIGVIYEFLDGDGNELVTETVWADQSAADADWAEATAVTILTTEPASIFVKVIMGKDATGTAYFDNINCGTTPDWSMGLFNGNIETVDNWLSWYASDNGSYGTVTDNDAHTGDYAQELYKPDTTSSTSEIVYYSAPFAVEAGEWYKVAFWVKTSGVNSDASFEPTYTMRDRLDDRMGITYFWHIDDPLNIGWSLEGGDKFVYINQTTTDTDWTLYEVAEQAPENATGISVRSRYTSNPTGLSYWDDFCVTKLLAAPVAIDDDFVGTTTPSDFVLSQNYPNPFNPTTTIAYDVPVDGMISLDIYNLRGQKVKTLYSGHQHTGRYSVMWDATDEAGEAVSTGVYLYVLTSENTRVSNKMVLIR